MGERGCNRVDVCGQNQGETRLNAHLSVYVNKGVSLNFVLPLLKMESEWGESGLKRNQLVNIMLEEK